MRRNRKRFSDMQHISPVRIESGVPEDWKSSLATLACWILLRCAAACVDFSECGKVNSDSHRIVGHALLNPQNCSRKGEVGHADGIGYGEKQFYDLTLCKRQQGETVCAHCTDIAQHGLGVRKPKCSRSDQDGSRQRDALQLAVFHARLAHA